MGGSRSPEIKLDANGNLAERLFVVSGLSETEWCSPANDPWIVDMMREDWGFLDDQMAALYECAVGHLPAAQLEKQAVQDAEQQRKARQAQAEGAPLDLTQFIEHTSASERRRAELEKLAKECQHFEVQFVTLWGVETSHDWESGFNGIDGFSFQGEGKVVPVESEA